MGYDLEQYCPNLRYCHFAIWTFFYFRITTLSFARFSRTTFAKSIGPKAEIFITAWIGTPIHELGHAFFCLIFGHKIKSLKLFTPNSKDGTLGVVEHSYNKKNLYHQIGNFFYWHRSYHFGSLIIYCLLFFLFPGGKQIIEMLKSDSYAIHNAEAGLINYLTMIFSGLWTIVKALFFLLKIYITGNFGYFFLSPWPLQHTWSLARQI